MTSEHDIDNSGDRAGQCMVVILYETEEVLTRATSLCDHIMENHWTEVDIHVDHWPFEKLTTSDTAMEAAAQAAVADVLVVTTASEDGFSQAFMNWAELLLRARKNREGALVGLFTPGETAGLCDAQLHRLALRAGMDYLNHLPRSPGRSVPDQPDWCSTRAETFTGTLDEIIRNKPDSTRH